MSGRGLDMVPIPLPGLLVFIFWSIKAQRPNKTYLGAGWNVKPS
jgi:hypothetical protein